MPIYEYKCSHCGEAFERLLLPGEPEPTCPGCGAEKPRKLISNTSFRLKGSGWYTTDYASKAKGTKSHDEGDSKKPDPPPSSPPGANSTPTKSEVKGERSGSKEDNHHSKTVAQAA